jgi:3-hydroxyacyl-CoA dehydrogenase
MVKRFQKTSQAFKYSQVPVIAASTGLALGGGCEFLMHATTVTASLETYAGLVEVGVGLLPAGGGCKVFAVRAAAELSVKVTHSPSIEFRFVVTAVALPPTAVVLGALEESVRIEALTMVVGLATRLSFS